MVLNQDNGLRTAKATATRIEKRRVFEDFNAPRDIYLEHNGAVYVRRVWQSVNQFGWNRWQREV